MCHLNPPVTLKSDNTFYPFYFFKKGLSQLIYVFVDYLTHSDPVSITMDITCQPPFFLTSGAFHLV